MTNRIQLTDRMVGSLTPFVLRDDSLTAKERIHRLSADAGNVNKHEPGWLGTVELNQPPDSLLTAWVQFPVVEANVTGESMRDAREFVVCDMPLPDEIGGRLLLVGATSNNLEYVLPQYLKTLGLDQHLAAPLLMGSDLLKAVFADQVMYALTAVEGHEHSLPHEYEGDTRITSLKSQDVRYDTKFAAVLDEPWKMIRFIPRLEVFDVPGLPPKVELREGGSIRLWKHWEDWVPGFLRDLSTQLVRLAGTTPDEPALQKAAVPPTKQTSLPGFKA